MTYKSSVSDNSVLKRLIFKYFSKMKQYLKNAIRVFLDAGGKPDEISELMLDVLTETNQEKADETREEELRLNPPSEELKAILMVDIMPHLSENIGLMAKFRELHGRDVQFRLGHALCIKPSQVGKKSIRRLHDYVFDTFYENPLTVFIPVSTRPLNSIKLTIDMISTKWWKEYLKDNTK